MYDLPLSVALIPAVQTEGAAIISALTGVGAAWIAISVVLYLVVIPLACRQTGDEDVGDVPALRHAA